MGDIIEITTGYQHPTSFYKVTSSAISFELKAHCTGLIGLAKKPGPKCDYTVGIAIGGGLEHGVGRIWVKGAEGTKTTQGRNCAISLNQFKRFWISWDCGKVSVGHGYEPEALCTLACSTDSVDLNYVAFTTHDQRHAATWRLELPPLAIGNLPKKVPVKKLDGVELRWVAPGDVLPDDSVIGGFQDECLYIIRGHHAGSLTPGLLVPSEGEAYVSWGGGSHVPTSYEVLVGLNYTWEKTTDNKIPVNAFEAGYSEVRQEKLYIGRVHHDGHVIPGKVQPSHKVCYVPYEDKEVAFSKFEILTIPDPNPYCSKTLYEACIDYRSIFGNQNAFHRNVPDGDFILDDDEDDDNEDEENFGLAF